MLPLDLQNMHVSLPSHLPLLQVDLANAKQCNIEFDQHCEFEKYTLFLKARSTLENWNETGGVVEDKENW